TADLESAREKLTDTVLDIAARAGFQSPYVDTPTAGLDQGFSSSGPPQTSLTQPEPGTVSVSTSLNVAVSRGNNAPNSMPSATYLTLGSGENGEARREVTEGPSEVIPRQGAGPHFRLGPVGMIALAPPNEIDAQGNDIARIRQLLPILRRAADNLIGHLNPNA